jgi:hypothetical protein
VKRSELETLIAQILLKNKIFKEHTSVVSLAEAIVKALDEAEIGPYRTSNESGLRHAIHYEREDI